MQSLKEILQVLFHPSHGEPAKLWSASLCPSYGDPGALCLEFIPHPHPPGKSISCPCECRPQKDVIHFYVKYLHLQIFKINSLQNKSGKVFVWDETLSHHFYPNVKRDI